MWFELYAWYYRKILQFYTPNDFRALYIQYGMRYVNIPIHPVWHEVCEYPYTSSMA